MRERCPTRDPWKGRCRGRATVELPNGRKVCEPCARDWAEANRELFRRLADFYRRVSA